MSLKMKRSDVFPLRRYIPIVSLYILAISIISIPVFAQQMSFTANLSGQSLSPPVGTSATGVAKFNVDPQGNMAYEIDVKNANGVIGAHISLQNGTDLAQVFNPYIETAGKSGIPTGEVNGQLSKGVLTTSDLSGTLFGKNVTDLPKILKNDKFNLVLRTKQNYNVEIKGNLIPTNSRKKK